MKRNKYQDFEEIAKFLRYWALFMSSKAGSGHPTSSLSAADLIAVLISSRFRFDFSKLESSFNDRLIFSKGHASPLYYALFAALGVIDKKELETYRQFGSRLEGHPTPRFPYTEASTGSLGQGLSVGVGIALALRAKNQKSKIKDQKENQATGDASGGPPNDAQAIGAEHHLGGDERQDPSHMPCVYVLLGDGEMAEGSVWEAIGTASKYRLNNLVAILDVNRLGQSDETMIGHEVEVYRRRVESFGWSVKVIDGHDYRSISLAYDQIGKVKDRPYMIIAKTYKGKGVSFLENKEGWHGKPLPQDLLDKALTELGKVDLNLKVSVYKPATAKLKMKNEKLKITIKNLKLNYKLGEEVATRKAYGTALAKLGDYYPDIVALDGDVKNSTYSEIFKEKFPDRFYEMYIAEQNMVGVAGGFSRMGYVPFVSTFAAFLTRGFDQIRMANISGANIKFCGSHAGVSIGEDGPSQMGLEDLAMFRAVYNCVVLYPADAVSTEKLVVQMAEHKGISYLRTSRPTTPVIYDNNEEFAIGGSKIHKNKFKVQSSKFKVIIVAAGVTLFEALKAQKDLIKEGIEAIVVDCYSVKPIDEKTLKSLVKPFDSAQGKPTTHNLQPTTIVTVEDHWYDGGLGDAVLNVFAHDPKVRVYKLAVGKMPRSGKSQQLLDYEGISSSAIIRKVREIL